MPKNKKYLIACSGGPDSMALLDKYHKDIVCICHVNYHIRPSSDRDQKIVTEYAKKHNINIEVKNIKKSTSAKHKSNFEAWAREVRYDFFCTIARKYNINDVLMAHHLDDWLETAVMQLKRKSLTTYYGIRKNNVYKNINIYRPLINKWKKELVDYCEKHKINYGIDETNFDLKYERNKYRYALSKVAKSQKQLLINNFTKVNKDLAIVEKYTKYAYKLWTNSKFFIPYLLQQPKRIQIEMVYQLLNNCCPKRMSLDKINGVLSFVKSSKGNIKYRLTSKLFI